MNQDTLLSAEDRVISNALKIRFYPMAVASASGTRLTIAEAVSAPRHS